MAKTKEQKPATKEAKPATKPATQKPAADNGVGIKQLAKRLGRAGKEKSVRAQIRRLRGGAQVGRGGRYRWDSETDPEFVKLLDELQTVKAGSTEGE